MRDSLLGIKFTKMNGIVHSLKKHKYSERRNIKANLVLNDEKQLAMGEETYNGKNRASNSRLVVLRKVKNIGRDWLTIRLKR